MTRSTMVHIISLVCVAMIAQVIRGCPNGWESFDGSCYFVSEIKEDWLTAADTCGLKQGHLAEVADAYEENFLKQMITKYHASHSGDVRFWLGGSDLYVEGNWRWMSNDQRIGYSSWNPGQPDDYLHIQDCMIMQIDSHNDFGWDDERCYEKYNFVCEIRDGSGAHVIG